MKNELLIAAIASMNVGGFTIDANTYAPIKDGYAVALAETQNSFGTKGLRHVLQSIEDGKANAIGGWYDDQTGLYYYDAVRIYTNWKDAYQAAVVNDQLAFYDLKECNEIRIKESLRVPA